MYYLCVINTVIPTSTVTTIMPTSTVTTIVPTATSVTPTFTVGAGSDDDDDGLTGGEIAGIVIGSTFAAIILLAIIILIVIWYVDVTNASIYKYIFNSVIYTCIHGYYTVIANHVFIVIFEVIQVE